MYCGFDGHIKVYGLDFVGGTIKEWFNHSSKNITGDLSIHCALSQPSFTHKGCIGMRTDNLTGFSLMNVTCILENSSSV